MPTRREFLSSTTVTLLLIPLTNCTTTATVSMNPSEDAGAGGRNGLDETSTSAADPFANNAPHTHTLCVLTSDLTNPPATGVTYETSLSLSHQHTVTLTQSMLRAIESGSSVTVTTSDVSMHTHMFTIVKMAAHDAGGGSSSGGSASSSSGSGSSGGGPSSSGY